jgi:hypothetical protein
MDVGITPILTLIKVIGIGVLNIKELKDNLNVTNQLPQIW